MTFRAWFKVGTTVIAVGLIAGLAIVVHSHAGSTRGARAILRPAAQAPSSPTDQVEQAFADAMQQSQSAYVPSSTQAAALRGALSHSSASRQHARQASILAGVRTNAIAISKRLFTGTALAEQLRAVHNAIAAQATGMVVEGGGVSNITYDSVNVNGTTAEVHAIVTEWSKFTTPGHGESTPSNELDVTATMVDGSSGWVMSTNDWTFVPGTGP